MLTFICGGEKIKKILPLLVVGIFVLSGLGAGAIQSNNETTEQIPQNNSGPRSYTHTVLVEVGTATWCSACPASNTAWHSIYGSGNYDFEYTELVYDKNSVANTRFSQFNPKYVPTSYWDGGEYTHPGTNYGNFYNYLDASGGRSVPDLIASLSVAWLGSAKIEIDYSVENNDASNYPGRIRIYVLELESTLWNDYNGNPYYHAFLDFAENKVINIPAAGSIPDIITWDGAASGYPGISKNNIQVILAVFDDEGHTSYSDPPSGNPFTAYYSDECIAAIPGGGSSNDPPETPTITGPTHGKVDTSYTWTFNSIDPDGDDVEYYILWGDGHIDVWDGPYASGTDADFKHTYTREDTFTISVKARDSFGDESGWGTLTVTMPRSRTINSLFLQFLQNHPNIFPILRQLLGL